MIRTSVGLSFLESIKHENEVNKLKGWVSGLIRTTIYFANIKFHPFICHINRGVMFRVEVQFDSLSPSSSVLFSVLLEKSSIIASRSSNKFPIPYSRPSLIGFTYIGNDWYNRGNIFTNSGPFFFVSLSDLYLAYNLTHIWTTFLESQ